MPSNDPVVIGRYHPDPGTRSEDFQLPGPGRYEADFSVPDWLVPSFLTQKEFSFSYDGHRVTHHWTREDKGILTVRFDVEAMPGASAQPEVEGVPLLLGGIMAVIGTGVLAWIGTIAFKSLKEVRLLSTSTAGKLFVGGAGILLLGAGLLLASRAVR